MSYYKNGNIHTTLDVQSYDDDNKTSDFSKQQQHAGSFIISPPSQSMTKKSSAKRNDHYHQQQIVSSTSSTKQQQQPSHHHHHHPLINNSSSSASTAACSYMDETVTSSARKKGKNEIYFSSSNKSSLLHGDDHDDNISRYSSGQRSVYSVASMSRCRYRGGGGGGGGGSGSVISTSNSTTRSSRRKQTKPTATTTDIITNTVQMAAKTGIMKVDEATKNVSRRLTSSSSVYSTATRKQRLTYNQVFTATTVVEMAKAVNESGGVDGVIAGNMMIASSSTSCHDKKTNSYSSPLSIAAQIMGSAAKKATAAATAASTTSSYHSSYSYTGSRKRNSMNPKSVQSRSTYDHCHYQHHNPDCCVKVAIRVHPEPDHVPTCIEIIKKFTATSWDKDDDDDDDSHVVASSNKKNSNNNGIRIYDVLADEELDEMKEQEFYFDHVYDIDTNQDDIYNSSIAPLVESTCCQGYHSTIIAYGEIGTGKTHTLLGPKENNANNNNNSNNNNKKASLTGIVACGVIGGQPTTTIKSTTPECVGVTNYLSAAGGAGTSSNSVPRAIPADVISSTSSVTSSLAASYTTTSTAAGRNGSAVDELLTTSGGGVIHRALYNVFRLLNSMQRAVTGGGGGNTMNNNSSHCEYTYCVRIRFLEIYNNEIIDLLAADSHKKQPTTNNKRTVTPGNNKNTKDKITLRWAGPNPPEVVGAFQPVVNNAEEALHYLRYGRKRRHTTRTAHNTTSSRSHALFTVLIDQRTIMKTKAGPVGAWDEEDATVQETRSKLNFVDLAAPQRNVSSPKNKSDKVAYAHFKEQCDINQSLLTLRLVIRALIEQQAMVEERQETASTTSSVKKMMSSSSPQKRIPYRDSKLTSLLNGSLGGDHKVVMIACISPAARNIEMSWECLRYMDQIRRIENKPISHTDHWSQASYYSHPNHYYDEASVNSSSIAPSCNSTIQTRTTYTSISKRNYESTSRPPTLGLETPPSPQQSQVVNDNFNKNRNTDTFPNTCTNPQTKKNNNVRQTRCSGTPSAVDSRTNSSSQGPAIAHNMKTREICSVNYQTPENKAARCYLADTSSDNDEDENDWDLALDTILACDYIIKHDEHRPNIDVVIVNKKKKQEQLDTTLLTCNETPVKECTEIIQQAAYPSHAYDAASVEERPSTPIQNIEIISETGKLDKLKATTENSGTPATECPTITLSHEGDEDLSNQPSFIAQIASPSLAMCTLSFGAPVVVSNSSDNDNGERNMNTSTDDDDDYLFQSTMDSWEDVGSKDGSMDSDDLLNIGTKATGKARITDNNNRYDYSPPVVGPIINSEGMSGTKCSETYFDGESQGQTSTTKAYTPIKNSFAPILDVSAETEFGYAGDVSFFIDSPSTPMSMLSSNEPAKGKPRLSLDPQLHMSNTSSGLDSSPIQPFNIGHSLMGLESDSPFCDLESSRSASTADFRPLGSDNSLFPKKENAFRDKKVASTKIQAAARGTIARSRFCRIIYANKKLQSLARCHSARSTFLKKRDAIQMIQRSWKSKAVLKRRWELEEAAISMIQAAVRGSAARNRFHVICDSIIKLQSSLRFYAARLTLQRKRDAAKMIQRSWRLNTALKSRRKQGEETVVRSPSIVIHESITKLPSSITYAEPSSVLQRKGEAAMVIQKSVRSNALFRLKRKREEEAATRIQAMVRGSLTKSHFKVIHFSTIKLQSFERYHVDRSILRRKRKAVLLIQRNWRSHTSLKRLRRRQEEAVTYLQRLVRSKFGHIRYRRFLRRIVSLQASVRGHRVRRALLSKGDTKSLSDPFNISELHEKQNLSSAMDKIRKLVTPGADGMINQERNIGHSTLSLECFDSDTMGQSQGLELRSIKQGAERVTYCSDSTVTKNVDILEYEVSQGLEVCSIGKEAETVDPSDSLVTKNVDVQEYEVEATPRKTANSSEPMTGSFDFSRTEGCFSDEQAKLIEYRAFNDVDSLSSCIRETSLSEKNTQNLKNLSTGNAREAFSSSESVSKRVPASKLTINVGARSSGGANDGNTPFQLQADLQGAHKIERELSKRVPMKLAAVEIFSANTANIECSAEKLHMRSSPMSSLPHNSIPGMKSLEDDPVRRATAVEKVKVNMSIRAQSKLYKKKVRGTPSGMEDLTDSSSSNDLLAEPELDHDCSRGQVLHGKLQQVSVIFSDSSICSQNSEVELALNEFDNVLDNPEQVTLPYTDPEKHSPDVLLEKELSSLKLKLERKAGDTGSSDSLVSKSVCSRNLQIRDIENSEALKLELEEVVGRNEKKRQRKNSELSDTQVGGSNPEVLPDSDDNTLSRIEQERKRQEEYADAIARSCCSVTCMGRTIEAFTFDYDNSGKHEYNADGSSTETICDNTVQKKRRSWMWKVIGLGGSTASRLPQPSVAGIIPDERKQHVKKGDLH